MCVLDEAPSKEVNRGMYETRLMLPDIYLLLLGNSCIFIHNIYIYNIFHHKSRKTNKFFRQYHNLCGGVKHTHTDNLHS